MITNRLENFDYSEFLNPRTPKHLVEKYKKDIQIFENTIYNNGWSEFLAYQNMYTKSKGKAVKIPHSYILGIISGRGKLFKTLSEYSNMLSFMEQAKDYAARNELISGLYVHPLRHTAISQFFTPGGGSMIGQMRKQLRAFQNYDPLEFIAKAKGRTSLARAVFYDYIAF